MAEAALTPERAWAAAGGRRSLTQLAHAAVAPRLAAGDLALDATVGNGHDTCFLAARVGPQGHVFGFEVQPAAVAAAARRLRAAGLERRVTLIAAGHEELTALLPDRYRGRLAAVMFNLGYCPGGDKRIVTRAPTTLVALQATLAWLRPGGVASVLAYRGHPGGEAEATAVADCLAGLDRRQFQLEGTNCGEHPASPQLHLLTRLPPAGCPNPIHEELP